jgi:hypothetical protein
VLARVSIDAAVGQAKVLNRTIALDVRRNDLEYVGNLYVSVPDGIGIHHHRRTVLALIEAAGLVGANAVFQSTKRQLGLEGLLKLSRAGRVAASASMSRRALVAAYEYVFCEFSH